MSTIYKVVKMNGGEGNLRPCCIYEEHLGMPQKNQHSCCIYNNITILGADIDLCKVIDFTIESLRSYPLLALSCNRHLTTVLPLAHHFFFKKQTQIPAVKLENDH